MLILTEVATGPARSVLLALQVSLVPWSRRLTFGSRSVFRTTRRLLSTLKRLTLIVSTVQLISLPTSSTTSSMTVFPRHQLILWFVYSMILIFN